MSYLPDQTRRAIPSPIGAAPAPDVKPEQPDLSYVLKLRAAQRQFVGEWTATDAQMNEKYRVVFEELPEWSEEEGFLSGFVPVARVFRGKDYHIATIDVDRTATSCAVGITLDGYRVQGHIHPRVYNNATHTEWPGCQGPVFWAINPSMFTQICELSDAYGRTCARLEMDAINFVNTIKFPATIDERSRDELTTLLVGSMIQRQRYAVWSLAQD